MELLFGKSKVKLVQGDITLEKTQAIVVPANPRFVSISRPGGVYEAVARRGGEAIFEEAAKQALFTEERIRRDSNNPYFPVGHAILTGGGQLQANHVIHVNSLQLRGRDLYVDRDIVKKAVIGALEKAREHNLETISIPAIGTGAFDLSIRDAVAGTLDGIEHHFASSTTIKHVRLVMYSPEDHAAAVQVFKARLAKH